MKDIDAVCIVTPNNRERKKQFLKLKKTLPQLKAFPAIIGNALTHKNINSLLEKKILDRWSVFFSRSGEIGCYLSHLQILQDFSNSKQRYKLILEDDMRLEKNFTKHLKEALLECPENWDFLYLYANPIQMKLSTTIKGKMHILKAPRLWGTCAYVVSQKGVKKIINNIQPMRANPIDEHFGDLVDQKKLKAFVTKKTITKHLEYLYRNASNQFSSTIHNTENLMFSSIRQELFIFLYLCYFFSLCIPIKIISNYWLPSSEFGLKRFPLLFLTKIKSKIKDCFKFPLLFLKK